MKHIGMCALSGLVIILLGMKAQSVQAQDPECGRRVSGLMTDTGEPLNPVGGVTITVEILAGGNNDVKNLVVIGQDPEEEGLSLNVTVAAVTGIVVYDETWPETFCVTDSGKQMPMSNCENDENNDVYHYEYWDVCHPNQVSPAHRTIKNIKVWLEPSEQTARWLGWAYSGDEDKAPLRYIFPEKWMAGTWTEDGFVVTGTPDKEWNETYYKNWLAQLEGYNFLAGDTATISNLWSVTLIEVTSPNGNSSLGVFGNFNPGTYLNPYPSGYQGGPLNISYDLMNSYTDKKRAESNYDSEKPLPSSFETITLELKHIPMDLPGLWKVGVVVELEKAVFIYGHWKVPRRENPDPLFWGADNSRWFTLAEEGYNLDNASNNFYEYILLSTPCNPMEADNCFDNSY